MPEQVKVLLHQLAGAVKEGLLAFFVVIGLQAMQLKMDQELNDVLNLARSGSELPLAYSPQWSPSSSSSGVNDLGQPS